MDVSAVSSAVHPPVAEPPAQAEEDWGPDDDGDADDAALSVKSFAARPASPPAARPDAQAGAGPGAQPAGGGALYL